MKTNIFKPIIILLFLVGFITIEAQSLFDLSTLDEEEYDAYPLKWDEVNNALEKRIGWAKYTAGGGVGFGWSDNDGNSETSTCISGEFSAKVIGKDKNPYGAGYVGAFGSYHNTSSDNFDESGFGFGAKFSYYDRITAQNEAQLIYGASIFSQIGKRDFSGFKEDATSYGARVFGGVNFWVSNKVSVGVEVPVLSYLSTTFEANGSESKQDSFSVAINKDNPVMATFRINLGSRIIIPEPDEDGDGIYDQDDKCPNTPGLEAFHGCPDTDGDGIMDVEDSCPNEAGLLKFNGCPDPNG